MGSGTDRDTLMVRALRLLNQGLVGDQWDWRTPPDAARGMMAIQAQDYTGAKLALALRSGFPPEEEVDRAIANGEIVRSRPSRGTLQFAAPEDMHWLTDLMAGRSIEAAAKRRAQIGVTDEMLAASEQVLRETLSGGRVASRSQVLEAFGNANLPSSGHQASHILSHHTASMNIVFGAPRDKEETFALADEWITGPRTLDREIALSELAERFFTTRGPATAQDLGNWAHLRMTAVREAIEIAGESLVTVEIGGVTHYLGARSAGADGIGDDEIAAALSQPLLLPPFDEFLISYRNRDAILDPGDLERVIPGRNGMFMPIIVVGGKVAGVWKRTLRATCVKIELRPFGKLPKTVLKQLDRVIADYGRYLGLDTETEVAD